MGDGSLVLEDGIVYNEVVGRIRPGGFGPSRLFKMTLGEAIATSSLPSRDLRSIHGAVYLAQGTGSYYGLHKIGFTTHLPQRLKQLKKEYGAVRLVHQIWADDPRYLETQLHRLFSSQRKQARIGTEWFYLSPEQIQWFRSLEAIDTCFMEILRTSRLHYFKPLFDPYTEWYEAS
jgi:hypothetical protein